MNLIPVSQWKWNLYQVKAFREEGDEKPFFVGFLVTTQDHVWSDIDARFDRAWIEWELLQENVKAPPIIGRFHGVPMSEDHWLWGEKLAKS